MSNQQKYILCDIDGCTIDDEWRLHLIDPEKHDFDAYHEAMDADRESLPIGKLFIDYAIENKIGLMFFTAAPEKYRNMIIDRLKKIYGLELSRYTLVTRANEDFRPAAKIKEEMLHCAFADGYDKIIAAIDDNYDVVEMYRQNGIQSYVVSKTQLIDASQPTFRDLLINGNAHSLKYNDDIDVVLPAMQFDSCLSNVVSELAKIYPAKVNAEVKPIYRPKNIGAAHEKFAPAFLPAEEIEGTQDGARGNEETGRKFDSDKLRFSLLPVDSLEEVVKVLEFGAKKYSVGNWKKVDNADQRYYDAALRHMILGSGSGELNDPETKRKHTAHAICCLLFKLHFELEADKNVKSDSND